MNSHDVSEIAPRKGQTKKKNFRTTSVASHFGIPIAWGVQNWSCGVNCPRRQVSKPPPDVQRADGGKPTRFFVYFRVRHNEREVSSDASKPQLLDTTCTQENHQRTREIPRVPRSLRTNLFTAILYVVTMQLKGGAIF